MNQAQDKSVVVTGEQHTHPAVRLLARACIALAQDQLQDEAADKAHPDAEANASDHQPGGQHD